MMMDLFKLKGEKYSELKMALDYVLSHSSAFPAVENIIDIVGTGGDGAKTFNISTAASLLLAKCGVRVAKHGGRSATSLTGSADVIEHLGIPFLTNSDEIIQNLEKDNYAYLCAPLFNPILKAAGPKRKELGVPTIFNVLGPLVNPLKPKRRVIGVYKKELLLPVAQLCESLGCEHVMVVHSADGLDELSICDQTFIVEMKNGHYSEYSVTPESVGLKRAQLHDIAGGDAKQNAHIIQNILARKCSGAKRDVVILNAAAGLVVSGRAANLKEGVQAITQQYFSFCSIFRQSKPSIIAEIKFASPSLGQIYQGKQNHLEIARDYLNAGADALSVLTEQQRFKGNIQYIADIRQAFPECFILRKDFLTQTADIEKSKQFGADAVLLIAGFLEFQKLKDLYLCALEHQLTPLIEVHTEAELAEVLTLNPSLIGINNRNLNTLKIDMNISKKLIHKIPDHIYKISESGFETATQINEFQQMGFNGFLIGTAFMQTEKPGEALQKFRCFRSDMVLSH
jgi:anthranilate phosphoribosyltransferase